MLPIPQLALQPEMGAFRLFARFIDGRIRLCMFLYTPTHRHPDRLFFLTWKKLGTLGKFCGYLTYISFLSQGQVVEEVLIKYSRPLLCAFETGAITKSLH